MPEQLLQLPSHHDCHDHDFVEAVHLTAWMPISCLTLGPIGVLFTKSFASGLAYCTAALAIPISSVD